MGRFAKILSLSLCAGFVSTGFGLWMFNGNIPLAGLCATASGALVFFSTLPKGDD